MSREDIGIRAKAEFNDLLYEIAIKDVTNANIKGKFYLIKYTHDKIREEDFIKFLFNNITTYSLTKEERDRLGPEKSDEIIKLAQTAFSRFVKNTTTGEFGEIILFHFLELTEGAVQIVNKMPLKTAGNVHSFGADALHFSFKDNLKVLYLGESKTGKSFSEILNKSLTSTENHSNDLQLACNYLSDDIPDTVRKEIKDYLNPLKKNKEDFSKVHAIFLGYQCDQLTYPGQSGKELLDKVIAAYKEEIETYFKNIEEQIKTNEKLSDQNFLFFVIPFTNIGDLRSKFAGAINNGAAINI